MTEAPVAAVFHLSKPNLMRGERICAGPLLYTSRISVQYKWSLCPCFMCGPRSTSVLGLRILQSYVPLRAGRCECLPHMKYRTEGDISYLMLNPESAYSRSGGYLIKPQSVCSFKITQSRFYPLSNPSNASSFLLTTFLSFVPLSRSYSSKQRPSSFSSLRVR